MNVDGEVLLFLGISIPSIRSCFCTIRTCRIANTSRSQFLGMLVMSFDSTFVIAESEPLHSSLAGTVYQSTNDASSSKACSGRMGEIDDLRGTRDHEQSE